MLLQKYTIRDLTTGQLFVVDAQPSSQGAEALSEPGSPAKEGGLPTLRHLQGALIFAMPMRVARWIHVKQDEKTADALGAVLVNWGLLNAAQSSTALVCPHSHDLQCWLALRQRASPYHLS